MSYRTISEMVQASFVEKRSEFLAYLIPVTQNEEAIEWIQSIKADHRKAKHHVYAYILREGNIVRYSDDGEPQGTAGVPVLDVLQKQGLTDVLCVVVRYFGGILLGGGGLVRAYSHSATLAVNNARILHMLPSRMLRMVVDYTLYGKIAFLLPQYEILERSVQFLDQVHMELQVKEDYVERVTQALGDLSSGSLYLQWSEPMDFDFSSLD